MGKFSDAVLGFTQEAEQAVIDARIDIQYRVGKSLVNMTPLGEVDAGRAKAGWQASKGSGITTAKNGRDPSGYETIGAIRAQCFGEDGTLYYTNNEPYINMLEYGGYSGNGRRTTAAGFSTQAPAGMARVTVKRFQSELSA